MREGSTDTAIDLRSLTRFYGARRGIEDLTPAIGRGEVVGFLGRTARGRRYWKPIEMLFDGRLPGDAVVVYAGAALVAILATIAILDRRDIT